MNNFDYSRASDVADAVRQIAADPAARFIAGGTNLIDLVKENVARPSRLIDITQQRSRLPPANRGALSLAGKRNPCRRFGATAQYGLHGRQPAAAHALSLFL